MIINFFLTCFKNNI